MSTLTKVVYDCETGETAEVEMTAEEVAQHEANAAAALAILERPTPAEQVDQIVADAKAKLAAAGNDTGKAIAALAEALDGLGATFGTGRG